MYAPLPTFSVTQPLRCSQIHTVSNIIRGAARQTQRHGAAEGRQSPCTKAKMIA